MKERFPFDYFEHFCSECSPLCDISTHLQFSPSAFHVVWLADNTRRIATDSDAMLSGFESRNTDRTGFDWDDGDGAFSVNNTRQGTRRRDDDNDSDEEDEAIDYMAKNVMNFILLQEEGEEEDRQGDNVQTKKRRQPKKTRAIWVDSDGSVRSISPRQTVWYSVYILKPDLEDPKFHKIFCRRFRLPYAQFLGLGERLEAHEIFARWHVRNVNPFTQEPPTPIPLLLLTSLRYLGRGLTFDDLAESTAIHEETVRVFFHCFIDYGSSVLYALYIRPPTCAEEAQAHISEYVVAGFSGAIGSTDATHILIERVAYRLRQTHLGSK